MYRYKENNAVTYTSDDLDLFRESPFALWMERLTLENPDHGILPDLSAPAPVQRVRAPTALVETLRAEGKQVAYVSPELDEPERREATVSAMHEGVDFIAGGQLAVGTFSGFSQLLMRTSGYTDLGDFLYIPCEEEFGDTFHAGFRLAFIANLLHGLQGQLPPQMLIIRDGSDVVPLQTDDHIHYFRSVFARFEQAMLTFRKHRMPDPSESSHFGRWSGCASEVLKQRVQSEQARGEEDAEIEAAEATRENEAPEEAEALEEAPLLVAAGAAAPREAMARSAPASAWWTVDDSAEFVAGQARSLRADAGPTLAEQARMLKPGSFRRGQGPGHTPNLAHLPRARGRGPAGQPARTAADAALQNLEFIGSRKPLAEPVDRPEEDATAPAPTLRARLADEPPPSATVDLDDADMVFDLPLELSETVSLDDEPEWELDVPQFLPPGPAEKEVAREGRDRPPRASRQPGYSAPPTVDLDSAPSPSLTSVRIAREKREKREDEEPPAKTYDIGIPAYRDDDDSPGTLVPRPFDDRLNTSADFDED